MKLHLADVVYPEKTIVPLGKTRTVTPTMNVSFESFMRIPAPLSMKGMNVFYHLNEEIICLDIPEGTLLFKMFNSVMK